MSESILLVDDESGICNVLGLSLADEGYEVHTASNGIEALNVFDERRPGIVITDIKMPGMDGIELLQALKKRDQDVEVIMMTGHGDMDLAVQSLGLQATDFITKPISEDALAIALGRAQERMFMRRQLREYTENLESLVEEKTRELVQAERLATLGQASAAIAHAVKNIASGLEGGMYVLEKGLELDEAKYLERGWGMIRLDVERIRNLSLELLEVASPRTVALGICKPKMILREVISLLERRAREDGILLTMECEGNFDGFFSDGEILHECLLNLGLNALDAFAFEEEKDGQKSIVFRVVRGEASCLFSVQDNGCGMDDSLKSKLFQNFVTTKGSKGFGVGLMSVASKIKSLGGGVDVESEPGIGSTFTLILPFGGE